MSDKLSELEHIKADSRFLRGTIAQGLADATTGAVSEADTKLLKFHGSYQQDDRDVRDERRRRKLEPDYQFMVRVRLPGGVITPGQWLALDDLACRHASSGLRITTRQTFQFHGVRKENLRDMIGGINDAGLSTLAACGDDVRNVVSSVNPLLSSAHAQVYEWSQRIMEHVRPQTGAYRELWIDKAERTSDGSGDDEPLLGKTYLPRKFKFGIAVPPYNDVDVFSQDFGLIAIIEDGELAGFNLAPGGSMGATAGDPATYPQIGDLIGFVPPQHLLDVCWHAVAVQRDFGDRGDRSHARLKYTIDDRGLAWYRDELQSRLDFRIQPPRPYHFDQNGDRFGWIEGDDGRHHLTLQIPSGRLRDDDPDHPRQTGMREIARVHDGQIRMTCDQNVIIAGVAAEQRERIDALVADYGLDDYRHASGIRQHALACVALPTCGLAMAEAERYLPHILDRMEELLDKHGLRDEPIHFRMSGCPNGCSRPYLGEIALVGRAVGRYDLRLGADHAGERLNAMYLENTDEDSIVQALDELFARFASERGEAESFGDFVARTGVVEPPARRPALEYDA